MPFTCPGAQRAVLDTNTVMALWWFEDPALAPLAQAIDAGRFILLTNEAALDELVHVLAYRQFAIPPLRQTEILDHYRQRCESAAPAATETAALPQCRDADDQKFLELARDATATLLISRDKALLRLDRHRLVRPMFRIRTPEAVSVELNAGGT